MPSFLIFEEDTLCFHNTVLLLEQISYPQRGNFLRSQFLSPLFQQLIEDHTGQNELCVSRNSVDKLANIQSVFLDQLQSKWDSLRLQRRSTKKLGITNHHHDFSFLFRLQYDVISQEHKFGNLILIFCGAIMTGTPLFYTQPSY